MDMKNIKTIATASLLLSFIGATAQTHYDAARFSGNELNGTARFVGMGGAMSALGADISVIGSNPAGIGLFRGHDFTTSFGFNATKTASDFGGNTMNEKRNRASFDQIGFVYTSKIGNRTKLRYVNFGFNYHKSKNFNRQFASGGMLGGISQTGQMANMINAWIDDPSTLDKQIGDIYNYGIEDGLTNPYHPTQSPYPYLGVMGVRSELVYVNKDDPTQLMYMNGHANGYRSVEEGGISDYDFNVSFNVEDRMYFGATIGVHDVSYRRSSYYTEDVYNNSSSGFYEINNLFSTDGTGFDFKFGAIFRPFEESPFRFGIAVHTPIWYALTDIYSSNMYTYLEDKNTQKVLVDFKESPQYYTDGDVLRDYQMVTPWRFNVSMGTVVAGNIALGAEYEFMNYASAKLKYSDGYDIEEQNSYAKDDLKGVHTVRVGAEARILPSLSVRAGYNFSSSVFKESAYKALGASDMRTDTEYFNDFGRNTVTVGLGYRGNRFYADLAYKYDMYKSDFYAFSDTSLTATKVDNKRHQLLMTLGVHF
jgi:hypothetical protein